MCKNTCFTEKRPELFQETTGTMFLKARTKFFFGISKKKFIHHKRYPQDDHTKLFFCKKKFVKKIANKIRRRNLSKQNGVRVHATNYQN